MSDDTDLLHFLPYLRRGLVRHATEVDQGGTIGPATIPLSVDISGTIVDRDISLLAPHHVVAVAPTEIIRRWPAPGTPDAESNYFPIVELAAPDLPWRYSPATPGPDGRLRPWLALVVVEEGEGVIYSSASTSVGTLSVDAEELYQLPKHDDLWAWAHVQSSRPAEEVSKAVTDAPETLLARLVCPRWLEPDRTYRACLVNAFTGGSENESKPAWSDGPAVLNVLDSWTFTTAAVPGDFEELCGRLRPADDAGQLGVRAVDVSRPGLTVKWSKRPMVNDLVGALADVSLITNRSPRDAPAFDEAIRPILDEVLWRANDSGDPPEGTYDPLLDDPVVGPPFYGAWPSGVTGVPDRGWTEEVNTRTDRRMAAGVGAKVIRRYQEGLMAAAWDQLGDVRGVADELNRGRLTAEVNRSWQTRVTAVEAGDRLGLMAPLLTFTTVNGRPAGRELASGRVPNAIIDRAWMRRTPRGRGASASTSFVKAEISGSESHPALAFQLVAVAMGARPIDLGLVAEDPGTSLVAADALAHAESHQLMDLAGGQILTEYVRGEWIPVQGSIQRPRLGGPRSARRQSPQSAVVAAASIASAVTASDPLLLARASLESRIPGLATLLPTGELPAELRLTPRFVEPLFDRLARLDADVIVPGLDGFPLDRVRLLAVNAGFVGSFMVGANHTMADELRWREYPADLAATFFQRFFAYSDPSSVDIDPIDGWNRRSTVATNVLGAEATTALLIRGDVIRRYPDLNIFLAPPDEADPSYPGQAGIVQPSFESQLGIDVRVVGFPLRPDEVLGTDGGIEHFVVLEERVTAPRFGLDTDLERSGPLRSWDELAHVDFLPRTTHIPATEIPNQQLTTIDGIEWGRNGAHNAAATHQRPYRRAFRATELVSQ